MNEAAGHTVFSEHEVSLDPEFRPLNRWCLLSMIAVLPTPLVLWHPFFFIFPLLCLTLAVVGLLTMDEFQRGSRLAVISICIALLFSGWGISWVLNHQRMVNAVADEFGRSWLVMVREGKLMECFELTKTHHQRVPAGVNLETHYEAFGDVESSNDMMMSAEALETPHRKFQQFIEAEQVARIVALDGEFEIASLGNRNFRRVDLSTAVVGQIFQITPREAGTEPFLIVVELTREDTGNTALWKVNRIYDPDSAIEKLPQTMLNP